MPKRRKPNILLIGVDSLRADHMSCYHYPRQTTPHIDRFAQEGTLFENNYSTFIPTTSAYATMPEVRIAGIVSRDPAKRAQYATAWGARGYASLEALLEDPGIACVVLNTPPYLHCTQGLQAVQAGKHVFVAKPIAVARCVFPVPLLPIRSRFSRRCRNSP
jgi:hypothetical protein